MTLILRRTGAPVRGVPGADGPVAPGAVVRVRAGLGFEVLDESSPHGVRACEGWELVDVEPNHKEI